jgi:ABC-type multidrug transport system fused ATPase/permease subunit
MLLIDWLHECGHAALELAALTSSTFLHAVLHVVVYGTPVLLVLSLVWVAVALRGRSKGRRTLKVPAGEELLYRAHAVGLTDGIFTLILRRTRCRQVVLLLVAAAAMPTLYLTLEIPKHIVNHAIASADEVIQIDQIVFSQVEFLVVLCLLYLASLMANGVIKYWLNVYQGRVGERLIRCLRLLVYRGWRHNGRPGGQAQLIPIIVQEVEPVGGFAGEAFVTPVFQGGTFLTLLAFMLIQDPVLGGAALLMLPIQVLVIPPLQRRINDLNRSRVREVRRLGGLLGERQPAEDAVLRHLRLMCASIRHIQELRFRIYKSKFLMKSSINFLNNLIPFFFYLIGGYLVIQGQISFGALVAVLAAHKDFSAPLRELLMYYQVTEDVRVRYREMQRFVAGLAAQHAPVSDHKPSSRQVPALVSVSSVLQSPASSRWQRGGAGRPFDR